LSAGLAGGVHTENGMENRDRVEFYDGEQLLAGVDSSIVPPKGSYISILGKTWKVQRVTYALDHAAKMFERSMRANVELKAC